MSKQHDVKPLAAMVQAAIRTAPPPPPQAEPQAFAPVERWLRLDRRYGSTAVLELTVQGERILSRRVRHENDMRGISVAKAVEALEDNAGSVEESL